MSNSRDLDPDGQRLPIKLDTTTNGEFAPVALNPVHHQINTMAREQVDTAAKRAGKGRREFLLSACGAATTLLAMNQGYAMSRGPRGGYFAIDEEARFDAELANAQLQGDEFIFDVQGHFVNPEGEWLKKRPFYSRPYSFFEKADCPLAEQPGKRSYLNCLGPDEFVKDVFLDSDTDVMVLSFVPSARDEEPVTIEEAAATRDIVEQMDGTHRLLIHGRVNPNQPGDLEGMDQLAESYGVSAWKTYTQFGPDGEGYFLTDDIGIEFVEKARKLGVKNIAIHKGLPFGLKSWKHSLCTDIGPIAKRYPDVNFLVYHSGFIPVEPEGPYDPDRNRGIDTLIKTVVENDLGKHSNVYAELGSTWRYLMRDPDAAAHSLGKLIKYLGEDNILWGTDSIWYGSPQDQIQALRSFQISEHYQEEYGYAPITPEVRQKIFGLNALKVYPLPEAVLGEIRGNDKVSRVRRDYRQLPNPSFRTHGPRTRREFLNLLRWQGGAV